MYQKRISNAIRKEKKLLLFLSVLIDVHTDEKEEEYGIDNCDMLQRNQLIKIGNVSQREKEKRYCPEEGRFLFHKPFFLFEVEENQREGNQEEDEQQSDRQIRNAEPDVQMKDDEHRNSKQIDTDIIFTHKRPPVCQKESRLVLQE